MPTLRTLFSGGELFGVGARRAGWTHVDGYERDPRIAAVARRNGFDVRVADVCAVDYDQLAAVDHLHASPSCKTASRANPDQGETAEDRACAAAIVRAIAAHQGRSFTLENVWAYRTYESFDRITTALRRADFIFTVDHAPMADFGVPQTRMRLILRAVRRSWRVRVPSLRPTHGPRGGILLQRWRGWYAAIADLVETLPATTPARWQVRRLPRGLRETALLHRGARQSDPGQALESSYRPADAPTCSTMSGGAYRAYIVADRNAKQDRPLATRHDAEPLWTITASTAPGETRAFLVGDGGADRAGRWVAMTTQALGRFQTVPDDYIGLTPEINGNGVPPDFAEVLMTSLF